MVKYIGSKRLLVPTIVDLIGSLPGVSSVLDLFSGTSRVGHALKRAGYRVTSNDYLSFAHTLATCYVQADIEEVGDDARSLISELMRLPGEPGWFTETFCRESRFIQPKNGERVDAIREAIDSKEVPAELRAVLLVSLMEAADRVDSTTGVQMAYLKDWSRRSQNDLRMRLPDLLPRAAHGKGRAVCMDAVDAAGQIQADCAYIDPPYNQHSYLGNYHIWESLVRWDKPEHYGIACKRLECQTKKSRFNRKRDSISAFVELLSRVRARYLVVSFSDEGYIDRAMMESLLRSRGRVETIEKAFPRYVGAKIGIHGPNGDKVGRVGRLNNTEYLYVVVPDASDWSPPTGLAEGTLPQLMS